MLMAIGCSIAAAVAHCCFPELHGTHLQFAAATKLEAPTAVCQAHVPQLLPCVGAGEMRPPLTVVLINNGGGGIFSFLPIAESLAPEVFTPLWATPQNVDLSGMPQPESLPLCYARSKLEKLSLGHRKHRSCRGVTSMQCLRGCPSPTSTPSSCPQLPWTVWPSATAAAGGSRAAALQKACAASVP